VRLTSCICSWISSWIFTWLFLSTSLRLMSFESWMFPLPYCIWTEHPCVPLGFCIKSFFITLTALKFITIMWRKKNGGWFSLIDISGMAFIGPYTTSYKISRVTSSKCTLESSQCWFILLSRGRLIFLFTRVLHRIRTSQNMYWTCPLSIRRKWLHPTSFLRLFTIRTWWTCPSLKLSPWIQITSMYYFFMFHFAFFSEF